MKRVASSTFAAVRAREQARCNFIKDSESKLSRDVLNVCARKFAHRRRDSFARDDQSSVGLSAV